LVLALRTVPGVICYFNPNGEVLRDLANFREIWDACLAQQKIPLLLWMNICFFKLSDNFAFMDTVGNWQLDIADVEVIFPSERYEPRDIDYYMRNVTHYLLDLDKEIKTGEAIDGPGETNLSWTTQALDKPMAAPPRRVLRLCPKSNYTAVAAVLASVGK
jgi:hypothetical protein